MSATTPEQFAREFSNFVNRMAGDTEQDEAIRLLCFEHRTLQQGMVRFCIKFIKAMGDAPGGTDLRNEAAVSLCRKLTLYMDNNDLGYLPVI